MRTSIVLLLTLLIVAATVAFDDNWYSVPYYIDGEAVEVRSTPNTVEIFMHRALTDARAVGYLPLTEPLAEVQPQNLFDLCHGLSLSRQLRAVRTGREKRSASRENADRNRRRIGDRLQRRIRKVVPI